MGVYHNNKKQGTSLSGVNLKLNYDCITFLKTEKSKLHIQSTGALVGNQESISQLGIVKGLYWIKFFYGGPVKNIVEK